MTALLQHASVTGASLVGSSLLTVVALTSPLGLTALTAGLIVWVICHERHRQ